MPKDAYGLYVAGKHYGKYEYKYRYEDDTSRVISIYRQLFGTFLDSLGVNWRILSILLNFSHRLDR